jgi:hypothetical protein
VFRLVIFRSSAAFAAVLGIALAFIPLLAVHGVESALVLGLLLPPWVAANAASYTARNRTTRGIDLMLRSIGAGLFIWAIPLVVLGLSSLRIRQCAPGEGLTFMILGPAIGTALAGCVGVWVAGYVDRPRLSPWLAACVPIGAALLGLWAFYSTPTVYVFSAFAGYFPGAIYDDLVQIPTRYLTYRATTVIAVLALGLLFDALWDPAAGALDLRRRGRRQLGTVLVTLGALGIVAASYWHGDHLGHWVSEQYVTERLGKTEQGRHCIVHMPRETLPEDAHRLLEDCDFHVARTRALIGASSKEPVTAYFFRNQAEKKDLIGVGRTLIAKPWRREGRTRAFRGRVHVRRTDTESGYRRRCGCCARLGSSRRARPRPMVEDLDGPERAPPCTHDHEPAVQRPPRAACLHERRIDRSPPDRDAWNGRVPRCVSARANR